VHVEKPDRSAAPRFDASTRESPVPVVGGLLLIRSRLPHRRFQAQDSGDKAVGADVVRSMAERAGATITEVEGSHVIMVSQPQVVADAILTAVAAVPRKEELRGSQ
jgi:hypothetical protein